MDLVVRTQKGDKKAFKELLIRYQSIVYGFAFSILQDTHEAEDISQEVFLKLFRSACSYHSYTNLRTFLLYITRNLCIDHLRKKRPENMPEPPEPVCTRTPYSHLCASELKKKIENVIRSLPENQRTAIYLRHVQGMSYKEISQTMGLTVRAVESLLSRARRSFRQRFAPDTP